MEPGLMFCVLFQVEIWDEVVRRSGVHILEMEDK